MLWHFYFLLAGLYGSPNANDLLYDPEEDKINEKFAKHLQKVSQNGEAGATTTDAILNCPGCMSLLSLNCQRSVTPDQLYALLFVNLLYHVNIHRRHFKYKTQYRTMFTFNCKVMEDNARGQITIDLSDEAAPAIIDGLKQVVCEICNTFVGVRESDGVYHLFNVLASHS